MSAKLLEKWFSLTAGKQCVRLPFPLHRFHLYKQFRHWWLWLCSCTSLPFSKTLLDATTSPFYWKTNSQTCCFSSNERISYWMTRSEITKSYQAWEREPGKQREETYSREQKRRSWYQAEGSNGGASTSTAPGKSKVRVERCYAFSSLIHGQPRIYTLFLEKFSPIIYARIIACQHEPPQTFLKQEMYCNN